jgi:hypothetical protein
MGKRFVSLLAVILGLSLATSVAHAAILDIRDGELFGAIGVDVNGVLYDVAFRDGTAIELYDGADENTDFPFTNPDNLNDASLAVAASQALLDQVFVDSSLGAFDSTPNLTNGCGAPGGCSVNTPLWVNASGGMGIIWAYNGNTVDSDVIGSGSGSNTFDSDWWLDQGYDARYDHTVYAVWSETTPVPIPAAVWLLGSGLIGIVGIRRRMR